MNFSFQLLCFLIVLLRNTGTSAVSDRVPEGIRPDQGVEPSIITDENQRNWKPTTSEMAKLLLHRVRDSADVFPPLKSVAGGLSSILENCEVGSPPHTLSHPLQVSQRTRGNEQAIESLAPRIEALSELLCGPVSEGDVKERERRKRLEQ